MSAVEQALMPTEDCTAGVLLKPGWPSLAGWYADPIAAPAAQALLDAAERRLQSRLCRGGRCFPLHVLRMICHHWLQSGSALDYRQLSALTCDIDERALVELVYGQLLISGKRLPARQHLARGFSLAAQTLDTADYFLLLRQHELLGYLPLSGVASVPQDLRSLLEQAAVIRRLQEGERRPLNNSHCDTVG
jgi:hypothetical protein